MNGEENVTFFFPFSFFGGRQQKRQQTTHKYMFRWLSSVNFSRNGVLLLFAVVVFRRASTYFLSY